MSNKLSPATHLKRMPIKSPSLTLRLIKIILRLTYRKKIRTTAKILKLRKKWEWFSKLLPLAPGVACKPITDASYPAEWLIPHNPPCATILYFHGGGYCLGSHKTHRAFLSYLCQITNARILSFDYRLSPEHPFPAALNDAMEIYTWLHKQKGPSSIYFAGDSAGGGLALALLLASKKEGGTLPKGVICFSPWTDLTHQGKTIETNQATDTLLYGPSLPIVANLYVGNDDPSHPYLSPLYGNLSNLPPIFIQTANEEILLSDSLRLFYKVKESKGLITLEIWKDRFHAWQYLAPLLPEAREALMHVKSFLEQNERTPKRKP